MRRLLAVQLHLYSMRHQILQKISVINLIIIPFLIELYA